MIFSCKFTYDKILTDPHITLFMEWEKDGVIITDDDRVDLFTEAMHIQGTPDAYYAELAYEYITLSDVGAYSCMLYSNGTTNTQYVINHVSMSAEYTVAIEGIVHTRHNYIQRNLSYQDTSLIRTLFNQDTSLIRTPL